MGFIHEREKGEQSQEGATHLAPIATARPLRPWHYFCLSMPFIGLLCPQFYSRWTPEIFGVPFFYAYQFVWIAVSAGLTAVVYRSVSK